MTPPLHIQDFANAGFAHDSMMEPPAAMGADDQQLFRESIAARTYEDQRSAALLWEHTLLPRYPQSPFLLVRVADIHAKLGSPATALGLYKKAQQIVGHGLDPTFDAFIIAHEEATKETATRQGIINSQTQYWQPYKQSRDHVKPVAAPTLPGMAPAILEVWHTQSDSYKKRFLNFYCIETNHIENVFLLTEKSTRDLVRSGLLRGMVDYKQESEVRNKQTIRDILVDTHETYDKLAGVIDDLALLTPQWIKDVHRAMLWNSTVLVVHNRQSGSASLKYTCGGETRALTQKTALINSGHYKLAFCPHEEVDKELSWICNQARQWIRTFRNPFAVAAWLHLVFIKCHPFDDGNGRMARLLASIPLVRAGYPPICIPLVMRASYYDSLNAAYNGQLDRLTTCFAKSLETILEEMERM